MTPAYCPDVSNWTTLPRHEASGSVLAPFFTAISRLHLPDLTRATVTSSERGDLPAKPVLFITRRHIGDAVMTTPVLELLHQRYPGTTIDIVAGPLSAALFEHCPYRGQIWRMAKGAGLADRLRLITALRRRRYELIVDLRTDGFAYLLRARERRTRWGAPDRRARRHDVERQAAIFDPCLPAQALGPPIVWLETQLIDSTWRAHYRWLAMRRVFSDPVCMLRTSEAIRPPDRRDACALTLMSALHRS